MTNPILINLIKEKTQDYSYNFLVFAKEIQIRLELDKIIRVLYIELIKPQL